MGAKVAPGGATADSQGTQALSRGSVHPNRRTAMSTHVWYASYGSNLSRERFLAYIKGGKASGPRFPQKGCTDPSPPLAERRILLLHRLYFAAASPQWEDGGVAFVRKDRDEVGKTLGRMYLITRDQFREVALQENGHDKYSVDQVVDWKTLEREGSVRFGDRLYGTLLHLGSEGGQPIVTFTAGWDDDHAPLNRPSPGYLKAIARGLRECYPLSNEGAVEYLLSAPGVAGAMTEDELLAVIGNGID